MGRLTSASTADRSPRNGACYRLGDGLLLVTSEVEPFAERFAGLFGDCAVEGSDPDLPSLECVITRGEGPELVRVEFRGPAPLDIEAFARSAFPDRAVTAFPLEAPWRGLTLSDASGETRYGWHGGSLSVLSGDGWPSFIGSLAVARTMRLQPNVAFVHAGAVSVEGHGVMICGPKGSGKTTLTLSMGARGHTVFGDEVAAVRLGSRQLLPFRRTASVRPGPTSAAAHALLAGRRWSDDLFADGQPRLRVSITELFPEAPEPEPTRLGAVILLRGIEAAPSIERTPPGPEVLGQINLLGASLEDLAPAVRAFKLLSTLAGLPCFAVRCGPVEETCRLIEGAIEK